MKCPICGGTGETKNIIGKREQTNEEWFDSLPITEKSEFMAKMIEEAIEVYENHGITWHQDADWWCGWLKAVHT